MLLFFDTSTQNFLENPNNYPCVNHIDCDRSNNNVENLEWCNYEQNNQYSMDLKHLCRNENNGRFYSGYRSDYINN